MTLHTLVLDGWDFALACQLFHFIRAQNGLVPISTLSCDVQPIARGSTSNIQMNSNSGLSFGLCFKKITNFTKR